MKHLIFTSLLFTSLAATCLAEAAINYQNDPKINQIERTASEQEIHKEEFNSFEETRGETLYTLNAKKTIGEKDYLNYEQCSFFISVENLEEQIKENFNTTISYNFEVDYLNKTLEMNIINESSSEVLLDNFTGLIMKNPNDKADILLPFEEKNIFMSQLIELPETEQCSLLGNILHLVVNLTLLAYTIVTSQINLMTYVTNLVINYAFDLNVVTYRGNYEHNSSLNQPKTYVYGQDYYANWRFGFCSLKTNGCEVIAGYNLARAKGINITLADTIFYYEHLGIEIPVGKGLFGSNPYQIWLFLKFMNIRYTAVSSFGAFKKKMEDKNNYYFILSIWSGESVGDPIHTFFIKKTFKSSKVQFEAYNRSCNASTIEPIVNYRNLFLGNMGRTYIVSYFASI